MIFFLFRIGKDRYAIEAGCVVEVLPRVQLKAIPQAPKGIAGVANYHGQPMPVVDLNAIALDCPSAESMSTRLLVVRYPDVVNEGSGRLLGVLVEMATETVRYQETDFQVPGATAEAAPFLGPVVTDARGIIQWVKVDRLLSPEVQRALWQQAEGLA